MGSEDQDSETVADGEATAFHERAPAPPDADLRNERQIDRFVLISLLGRGGMGVVYRAYDPRLDRFVALKLVLPRREDTSALAAGDRLIREARLMARLSHPNVLKVHEVGQHGDRVFLAMDLVEGTTLRKWMKSQRRHWIEVLVPFVAAGRGLAAAHALGLVHRDFKPDNVLMDGEGHVFVADFGLARPVAEPTMRTSQGASGATGELVSDDTAPRTRAGLAIGTPAYMAPEQHLAREVDARTDQYAFCVALWEALYGSRPFQGKSVDELVSNVMRARIADPPHARGVPRWLRAVLLRGMSRAPTSRFRSMETLLDELEIRPARRRRRRRALLAVCPVVLGAAAAFGWQATAADRICPASEARDEGWDAGREQALLEAYARAGATDWAEPVLRGLSTQAAAIGRVRSQACLDHEVRRIRSSPWKSAVDACIERHAARFDALVDAARSGDRPVLGRAPAAIARLGSPAACLERSRPFAGDARRSELARRIDRAWVELWLGRHEWLASEEVELLEEARALEDDSLLAELESIMGQRRRDGAVEEVRTFFDRAIAHAEAAGDDWTFADAWVQLAGALAHDPATRGAAIEASAMAAAAIQRAGGDAGLELRLARLHARLGGAPEQRATAEAALVAALDAADGATVPDLERAEAALALAQLRRADGRTSAALDPALRALALAQSATGTESFLLAPFLRGAADVLAAEGHVEQAERHHLHADRVASGEESSP